MATIEVVGREPHVRFSGWERLAVWRGGFVVPLAAVRAVEHVDRPLAHARGGRAGIVVSGVLKVGTWRLGSGARQLVSVRRTVPALRITLDRSVAGGRFDELLISARNADQLAELITNRAAGR